MAGSMGDSQSNGGGSDKLGDREANRLSITSDFSHVSTTGISNRGDSLEIKRPLINHVLEPHKMLTLSDVKVELDISPPVPSTPLPSLDRTGEISC